MIYTKSIRKQLQELHDLENDIIKHQEIEKNIYKDQMRENNKREYNLKRIIPTHKTIPPSQQFIMKEDKSFSSLKSIQDPENDLLLSIENENDDNNISYNSGEDLSYRK